MKLKEIISLLLYTSIRQVVQFTWFRTKLIFIRRFDVPATSKSAAAVYPLKWKEAKSDKVFIVGDEYTFLNRAAVFKGQVDWGFSGHGKLWTFHLQSFEFLRQEQLGNERCIELITDFSDYLRSHPSSFEPYTASLRIISWIKYFSGHQVSDKALCESLLQQTRKLYHSIEWHLQNNHLLENSFALLFAGVFFGNEKIFVRGKKILEVQVEKQILADGAHFELSPMYHQLMLQRILDCIQLLRQNRPEEKKLLHTLTSVASRMLGWMNEMKFENGDMPVVNDSANGIAPACEEINRYADLLGIPLVRVKLMESGFRKFKTATYECLIDVGGLEPDVNAGHGHSDSLSFILYVHNKPFIIDTGVSTYDKNVTRLYERSSLAHNTISPGGKNQSRIWGSFRVGKRVKLLGVKEGEGFLEASIMFFDKSLVHHRRFEFSENFLKIIDNVSGEILEDTKSFFYVDKKSQIAHVKSQVNSNIAKINFEGGLNVRIDEALASSEFNKQIDCYRLTTLFNTRLITTFTFHSFSKTGA